LPHLRPVFKQNPALSIRRNRREDVLIVSFILALKVTSGASRASQHKQSSIPRAQRGIMTTPSGVEEISPG
jgi:hypothetical protein